MTVAAPVDLLHHFSRNLHLFDEGGHGCRLAEYMRMLATMASVLNLVVVTVDRFVVVVLPLKYKDACNKTNCKLFLFIIWGLSVLLAIPIVFTKVRRRMFNRLNRQGQVPLLSSVGAPGLLRQQRHHGHPDLLQPPPGSQHPWRHLCCLPGEAAALSS